MMMTDTQTLEHVEAKLEAAAAALVPVMSGRASTQHEITAAVHDALNLLASARLRIGLALEATP